MAKKQVDDFGESGFVFIDERTPKAYQKALADLVMDPAKAKAMGKVNRLEIEVRWSWDVWAEPYADFLRMRK
jgi:phosphatidylinositol alpha-1,6-mannosyltransferase